MAKQKAIVQIYSYGLYQSWDRESKDLPTLLKITTEIETTLNVEFGYILRIRNARNSKLTFRIEHPPFKDDSGEIAPPFEGDVYIKTNDYRFYLGDTIWEPIKDKRGPWRLISWVNGKLVADKTLMLI